MVIGFFANNPKFFYKQDGRPMYRTFQFPIEIYTELPFY